MYMLHVVLVKICNILINSRPVMSSSMLPVFVSRNSSHFFFTATIWYSSTSGSSWLTLPSAQQENKPTCLTI